MKYCPQASKTESRLVIPSSSNPLVEVDEPEVAVGPSGGDVQTYDAPSPQLSMCWRSVRSRTISLARGIKSLTFSLRFVVRPAVSLPLHHITRSPFLGINV